MVFKQNGARKECGAGHLVFEMGFYASVVLVSARGQLVVSPRVNSRRRRWK